MKRVLASSETDLANKKPRFNSPCCPSCDLPLGKATALQCIQRLEYVHLKKCTPHTAAQAKTSTITDTFKCRKCDAPAAVEDMQTSDSTEVPLLPLMKELMKHVLNLQRKNRTARLITTIERAAKSAALQIFLFAVKSADCDSIEVTRFYIPHIITTRF